MRNFFGGTFRVEAGLYTVDQSEVLEVLDVAFVVDDDGDSNC